MLVAGGRAPPAAHASSPSSGGTRPVSRAPAAFSGDVGGRAQLVAGKAALDELLADFDGVVKRGGSDEVRSVLGTGGKGPNAKLDKTCALLAVDAEDPDAFSEALEEFIKAYGSADGALYSSVFAGGSGDPKKNKPYVFIAAARADIEIMRRAAGRMIEALGPPA
mmetsp:Transcript_6107/g.16965  ORF Transcript_6107/g.16965 Transcript_6107/m.16965 type:complete len:165 (+) Transcript_6107:79-573(+)